MKRAVVPVAAGLVALAACTGSAPESAGSSTGASASAPSTTASTPSTTASSPSTSASPSLSASEAAVPAPRLVASRLEVPSVLADSPYDRPRTVRAPQGWRVALWARVPGARLAVWAPGGRLLVSRPGAGDVVVVEQGRAPRPLLRGLTQPHGLAFGGATLYVAESDKVTAWAYGSDGTLSKRRVVVSGLPDARSPELRGAYSHALKSVAVGRDGWVYVSIGSRGNVSADDRDGRPERASILRVRATGGRPEVYARGVRNGTGLAVDPTGAVWTAVNNRDNIAYPYDKDYDGDGSRDRGKVLQAYVNDHPPELLARLTRGRDLGWPYCNPEPDVAPGVRGSALRYANRPFVRDVQTNADGSRLDCSALRPIEQGMGAHSAPLGLTFVDDPSLPAAFRQGALVGVHGSWNRVPPRPPEVSFFPWRNGTLGAQQTLLTGFQLGDGSRWGRPVMALPGPDGAIYVTDDAAGAVYRMTPPK
jgi:glucose/arabinose dehydrogenase